MSVDLSFFKNPENLIFLFIVLLAASAVFFIIFFILSKIFKLFKKFFLSLFASKPKPKEEKSVLDADKKETFNAPRQRVMGGDFTRNINPDKDNLDNKNQDVVKVEREKEMASAAHGLEKLKSSYSPDKEPSKMSGLRDTSDKNQENEDDFKKIKIPRRKRFEPTGQTGEKESTTKETGGVADKKEETEMKEDLKVQPEKEDVSLYEKSDILNDDLKWISKPTEKLREEFKTERAKKTGESDHKNFVSKKVEDPFFGNKTEISRSELRQKLSNDPKVWRAQKEAGLSLSPLERVKLEKEVFSQSLGSNISKADLKSGIKKLNQKMFDSKDISEKTKIRKEISFFKKIGGIK